MWSHEGFDGLPKRVGGLHRLVNGLLLDMGHCQVCSFCQGLLFGLASRCSKKLVRLIL